jgi:phage protein D
LSAPAEASASTVKIKIDGNDVDPGDLVSFTVERDLGQPDMAAVILRSDRNPNTDFPAAAVVEIEAGINANSGVIFKGEVVEICPTYRAQGDSRVVVRAFNKLHRLTRGRKSKTFVKKSDQDIASAIASDNGLQAQTGSAPKVTHEHVYQHNQTDLEFLRVRAARLGYQVWVDDTKLHFDAPKLDVDSGIKLDMDTPGEHLLKTFSARMSTAKVVKKVTVRGWDPKKKEEIVGQAEAAGSPLGSKNGASVAQPFGGTVTYTVDFPIFSVAEANAIAKAKLGEHMMSLLTAEAECRGHKAYKPGIVVTVEINPDCTRFNGKYLVTGVTFKYTHGSGGDQSGGLVSVLRLARDAVDG